MENKLKKLWDLMKKKTGKRPRKTDGGLRKPDEGPPDKFHPDMFK